MPLTAPIIFTTGNIAIAADVNTNFSTNKTQASLEEIEHTMYLLMIITSIFLITVNYIFYFSVIIHHSTNYTLK